MELPQILQPGRVVNNLPGRRTGAFSRAIVDDRDLRVESPHQSLGIGEIRAVMTYEKKIHFPQEIVGTRDFKLFLLGEVSEIKEPELAVGDHDSHRARVLSIVDRSGRFSGTKRIRLPRAGQRFSDVIARRTDHAYLNTFDRQSPSRFH